MSSTFDAEIVSECKTNLLLARPMYSTARAIKSGRMSFLVGVAFVALGLLGSWRVVRWNRRENRTGIA